MIDDALFEEYASAIDANSDLLRAAVSSLESRRKTELWNKK